MSITTTEVGRAVDALHEPGAVSLFDRRVYRAIAAYAFDEAEAHPSQERIAQDLGCARESVNRAVRRLIKAGWLVIKEKRWWPRSRSPWCHNVYELLAEFVTGALTIRRIVRRAHARKARVCRDDHTNRKYGCRCGWCRPVQTPTRPPPRPLSRSQEAAYRLWEVEQERKKKMRTRRNSATGWHYGCGCSDCCFRKEQWGAEGRNACCSDLRSLSPPL